MSWMAYGIGVFVGLLIALLFLVVAAWPSSKPLDDTDNKFTGARSDMRILIDHGTGCQYLRSGSGGLTPRLDAAGQPICTKESA